MSGNAYFTSQTSWAQARAYPIITVAVVLACSLLGLSLLKRPSKPQPKPLPAVPKCFRIQEIPDTITKDELLQLLANSTPSLGEQSAGNLRLTLARSFGRYSTATLVSTEKPRILEYPIDSAFIGITPLFDTADATTDIIAVHGLGSHAIGGFKSKGNSMVWLRDFLPEDVPNARVLVYGYDSAVTNKNDKISITGLAKTFLNSYKTFREETETTQRPIIFIGHSLGGLLVKEALSMALDGDQDPQNDNFFNSSYGLVFFGVPNLGLRLGKLKEITGGQLNQQLIHDLELDTESEPTPYLRSLQDRFISCHRKQNPPFRIISYYEQKKTPTVILDKNGKSTRGGDLCFMVTQESACRVGFEDDTHSRLPLPMDHSDLVKFSGRADSSYRIVQNKLRTLIDDASSDVYRRFWIQTELSQNEKRHWDDLNVPDYRAFKENKEKLAQPADGTLRWLIQSDYGEAWPAIGYPDELEENTSISSSGGGHEEWPSWIGSTTPHHAVDSYETEGLQRDVIPQWDIHSVSSSEVEYAESMHWAYGLQRDELVDLEINSGSSQFSYVDRSYGNDSLRRWHFEQWKDSPESSALIVTGPPGQGKSVLSNFVVDHLQDSIGEQRGNKVIYYFCNIKDGNSRNSSAVLRALIVQLCEDQRLFQKLPNRFRDHPEPFHSASWDDLWRTFDNLVKCSLYHWIYCVIDGLDVYESGMEELAAKLQAMVEDPACQLKLICTSRPTGPLDTFPSENKRALRPSNQDMELFVREEINSLPGRYKSLKTYIYDSVLDSAGGTFLWIHIVLREIRNLRYPSKEKVSKIIEGTPYELHGIYTTLVQAAFNKDAYNAAILAWVAFAKRPLSFKELEVAAAVMLTQGTSWTECCDEMVSLDEDVINDNLGTLVDVVDGQIFLIHQSLLDFLTENTDVWKEVDRHPPFRRPKVELSGTCLKFLNFRDLEFTFGFPFYKYAKSHWLLHIESTEVAKENIGELRDLIYSRNMKVWLKTRTGWITILKSPVEIAIEYDLDWLARLLIDPSISEISGDFTDQNLVDVVSKAPNVFRILLDDDRFSKWRVTEKTLNSVVHSIDGVKTLELLLQHVGNKVPITAELLVTAAEKGDIEIFKLLLDNASEQCHMTPEMLKAAIGSWTSDWSMGREEILRMLLDGADLQIPIAHDILLAAVDTKKSLALLLEKRGKDIYIPTDILVKAASKPNGKELLELLLEKPVKKTPITPEVLVATLQNYKWKEILEILIVKRPKEIQVTSAVVAAAIKSDQGEEICELLRPRIIERVEVTPDVVRAASRDSGRQNLALWLDKGDEDFHIPSEAITTAAKFSLPDLELLQLLLEKGGNDVQINTKMLLTAAKNMSYPKEMFEILLEHGEDEIQITHNVIIAAAKSFKGVEILKLLLEKRDDEIVITPEAVIAAAESCRAEEMMQLLLESRGNEVQITTEVVMAAVCSSRAKETIQLLLERRGDEVQITNEVVMAAISPYGGEEVVDLLLEKRGDEISITPEMTIAAAPNPTLLELLLRKRADDIVITPEVVTVAMQSHSAKNILQLLLEKRRSELLITSDLVISTAQKSDENAELLSLMLENADEEILVTSSLAKLLASQSSGNKKLELLLKKGVDRISITEDMLMTAARNEWCGDDVLKVLLGRSQNTINITTNIVLTAALNGKLGNRILVLLLEKMEGGFEIGPEIVRAAINNYSVGEGLLEVLLEKRGHGVQMTDEMLTERAKTRVAQSTRSWFIW